ncbi:MAG: FxsA family protein [Pseudomonadota bacterium]
MKLALIPFLLLVVPVLEIAVFITLGGYIGVFPTLGAILITAIIGTIMLRLQGFDLITRIRTKVERNELPGRELVHGVMLLVAGVLLLTPGFVTDTFGFLLFVPQIRDLIWRSVKDKVVVNVAGAGLGPDMRPSGARGKAGGPTIDLDADDYGETDNATHQGQQGPQKDSPWNKLPDEPR